MLSVNKKIKLLLGLIVILVGILFIKECNRMQGISVRPQTTPLISQIITDIPITAADEIYGNPGAPLTIIEFGDVSCSACRAAHYTIQKTIKANPTKARLIWKDAPLGGLFAKGNSLAHQAAFCAGKQNKFWEYLDLAMRGVGATSAAGLSAMAASLNLNMEKWGQCLNSEEAKEKVAYSLFLAQQLGLRELPGIFINNQKINLETNADLEEILKSLIK